MNVGGIPLAGDPEGFWILVALVATFTVIAGRWAFRKRGIIDAALITDTGFLYSPQDYPGSR
jgi:hypothetical protein